MAIKSLTLEKTIGKDENGKDITEKKIYVAPHPKARMVRKALEMVNGVDFENMKPDELDNMVDYVVELYGKQFSIDDVYDGINSDELVPTIIKCVKDVVGTMGAKLKQFPNAETGK